MRKRCKPYALVLGAAGGVGLAAVQIAKALGAKVVAVARGAEKMATLRAAGADACIDSDTLHGGGGDSGSGSGGGGGGGGKGDGRPSYKGLKAAVGL